MCEDYRAGASIDLKHDDADLTKKIACPLLTLWGLKGPMGRIYDVLAIWKDRGVNVSGKGLDGGHNLQEDVPERSPRRSPAATEGLSSARPSPDDRGCRTAAGVFTRLDVLRS